MQKSRNEENMYIQNRQKENRNTWKSKLVQDAGMRAALLLLADILAVYAASFGALLIRYELSVFEIRPVFIDTAYRYLAVNIVCTVVVFYSLRMYTSLWKYASVQELCNVVFAAVLSGVLQFLGMHMMRMQMPRSYYVLYVLLLLVFEICIRFGYRFFRFFRNGYGAAKNRTANVMVIGAGDAGAAICPFHIFFRLSRSIPSQFLQVFVLVPH